RASLARRGSALASAITASGWLCDTVAARRLRSTAPGSGPCRATSCSRPSCAAHSSVLGQSSSSAATASTAENPASATASSGRGPACVRAGVPEATGMPVRAKARSAEAEDVCGGSGGCRGAAQAGWTGGVSELLPVLAGLGRGHYRARGGLAPWRGLLGPGHVGRRSGSGGCGRRRWLGCSCRLVFLHPEHRHRLHQLPGLLLHAARSRRGFLDERGVLLRALVHLRDRLVHLLDARALFLRGRRDVGD